MFRSLQVAGLILVVAVATVQAGPCTSEIQGIEKAVNEPNSPHTPTLPQTVGAQIDQQPTPSSVARAQQQANARYNEVLNRARALDAQNNSECQKVVRELKDLVGMQ